MNANDRLEEWLLKWSEARDAGQELDPADLCLADPELLPELERRIRIIREMAWLEDNSESPRLLNSRYRLDRLIGRGGEGEIWEALDLRLNRRVAVKIPRSVNYPLEQSLAEARMIAELDAHPGILRVHDVLEENGRLFIISEFADANNLATVLSGKPMLPELATKLVANIAEILGYTHLRGILHRDIKPSNILIDSFGEPRLMDFGIGAKFDEVHTRDRGAYTLAYAAPERLRGEPDDHRSDIYSLGVVLFEVLTGRLPFEGASVVEMRQAILSQPVPDLRKDTPPIPKRISDICRRCLEKSPADRPSSMNEVARELRRKHPSRQIGGTALMCATIISILTFILFVSDSSSSVPPSQQILPTSHLPDPVPIYQEFVGHTGKINVLIASPDGRLAVSGSDDMSMRIWDLHERRGSIVRDRVQVRSARFLDNTHFACGLVDGRILLFVRRNEIWSVEERRVYTESVTAMDFTPDGRFLLSGSEAGMSSVWDRETGKVAMLPRFSGRIVAVGFTAESERFWLVVGRGEKQNGTIMQFRLDISPQQIQSEGVGELAATDDLRSAAMTPNGILITPNQRWVNCWRIPGSKPPTVGVFDRHALNITGIGLSPDGKEALSLDTVGVLWHWDTEQLRSLGTWHPAKKATCCSFVGDRQKALLGCQDGTILLLDLQTSDIQNSLSDRKN